MLFLSRRRRCHHPDPDEPTPSQRERLAIYVVAGNSTALLDRATAETRLLFARELKEHGRISEQIAERGGRDDR